jgi:hypothetical protein
MSDQTTDQTKTSMIIGICSKVTGIAFGEMWKVKGPLSLFIFHGVFIWRLINWWVETPAHSSASLGAGAVVGFCVGLLALLTSLVLCLYACGPKEAD